MQCGSGPGTLYETLTPPSWDDCPYGSRILETEKVLFEDVDDWVYQGNINDIKQLVGTYPFSLETEEMGQLRRECGGMKSGVSHSRHAEIAAAAGRPCHTSRGGAANHIVGLIFSLVFCRAAGWVDGGMDVMDLQQIESASRRTPALSAPAANYGNVVKQSKAHCFVAQTTFDLHLRCYLD